MNIKQQINLFKEKYSELQETRRKIDEQSTNLLRQELAEINPIIKIMKDNKLIFQHPNNNKIGTFLGMIIDESPEYFYIYSGENEIKVVNKFSFKEVCDSLLIEQFACTCDIAFVFKAIDFVRNYLEKFINIYIEDTKKRQEYLKTVENDITSRNLNS